MALSAKERRKRKYRRRRILLGAAALLVIALIVTLFIVIFRLVDSVNDDSLSRDGMMLTINGNSRTGKAMHAESILIKKSTLLSATATEIRNMYERGDLLNSFDDTPVMGGIHYAVGADGSVIECIPTDELAPGWGTAIVIEYSPDEFGQENGQTAKAVDELVKKLNEQNHFTGSPVYYSDKE